MSLTALWNRRRRLIARAAHVDPLPVVPKAAPPVDLSLVLEQQRQYENTAKNGTKIPTFSSKNTDNAKPCDAAKRCDALLPGELK